MGRIWVFIVLLATIIFTFLIFFDAVAWFNTDVFTVTVTDKERVVTGEVSYYLVFTTLNDGTTRVFSNIDDWLRGKFNSSDVQAALEVGKKYKIGTAGWRVPILSKYENIIWFEEVL